jgi:hypothetical protein
MSIWSVYRDSEILGHWIGEELRIDGNTLYAYRNGKIIGSVASGPGLHWDEKSWSSHARKPIPLEKLEERGS